MAESLQSSRVQISDSPRAIQDYCWEQGWTDGLPIVPPTEPLVQEMLSGYGGNPSESLGRMQPGNSSVTLEKLAVNAVMAGCLPEHFPVVVAALKAAMRDESIRLIWPAPMPRLALFLANTIALDFTCLHT